MESKQEITITVRGVDSEVWGEFQDSIRKKNNGNLYGFLGPELTAALKSWLNAKTQDSKSDYSKYLTKPDVPRVLDSQGGLSVKGLVFGVMKALGGEASIQEVTTYVRQKYGPVNPNTISTAMSDLSVNGPPSSLYRVEQRFLRRVSRGRYRLERETL